MPRAPKAAEAQPARDRYLTKDTWVEGNRALADELRAARRAGRPRLVMVHENDPEKGGCEFGRLFESTPADLIDDGLYYDTALALFPGALWPVSVAMVARTLGATEAGVCERVRRLCGRGRPAKAGHQNRIPQKQLPKPPSWEKHSSSTSSTASTKRPFDRRGTEKGANVAVANSSGSVDEEAWERSPVRLTAGATERRTKIQSGRGSMVSTNL